jgi:hypothetical protein
MEPSLEPYYRALAPRFFDHFLATGVPRVVAGVSAVR